MYPYWLLFLIFAAGALFFEAGHARSAAALAQGPMTGTPATSVWPRRRRDWLLAAAALLAALMIGFRYEVGADWDTYGMIFDAVKRFDFWRSVESWEPGYVLVNLIAEALGADIWLVNLICGLIFMYGLVKFATCQPNPWLTIVVGMPSLIILVAMGYSRQGVAIGASLAGFAALMRGSYVRFVLWVILAALFHRTAVILLPLTALSFSRNRLQTFLILAVGMVVGYYLLRAGWSRFERQYIERIYQAQGAGLRLAMNVPPALIFLAWSRRFTDDPTVRSVWRNMAIAAIGAFVGWLFIESTVALDRLALYLIPLQLFVLSRLPTVLANGKPSLGITALVIGYSAIVQLVWFTFANHAKYWIPYQLYPFFG